MGSNRDIKSDGAINITSTQTNISGDLDVSGSINNFSFPGSDGIAGQALTTNGSGTLSFSDVSGGGAGGINYITNTRATTDTTGYATYADAAATTPADGTGGSANITFTRNTTNPLRDGGDFKIAKDAANRQGEGVGNAFTIDNTDKAKRMLISFDYDASDSDYADDDIKIFVYDVTNTSLIRVNGEDLKGGKGKHHATFQTAADSTSYRLIFHVSSTNASAYDVFLDEISVGPVGVTSSSASDDVILNINGLDSTQSVNSATDTLVTGWNTPTTDTTASWDASNSKYVIPESGYYDVGYQAQISGDANSDITRVMAIVKLDTTIIRVGAVVVDGTVENNFASVNLTGYYMTKGQELTFLVRQDNSDSEANTTFDVSGTRTFIDIAKRNSLSLPDSISSGRDVIGSFTLSTDQNITANTSIKVRFDTTLIDTTSSFIASTATDALTDGYYEVPESGFYDIHVQAAFNDVGASDHLNVGVIKNTSTNFITRRKMSGLSANSEHEINVSGIHKLTKGDKIYVKVDSLSDSNYDVTIDSTVKTFFQIAKRQSAQTHIDNETVACKAFVNTDYTRSDSNSHTIQFNEIAYDTHAAFDTSTYTYTFPVSGYYLVHANVAFSSFSGFANARITDGSSSHSYVYFGANDDEIAGVTLTYMNYYSKGDFTKVYMDPQGITEDASYTVEGNATMGGTHVSHISITRLK